MLKYENRVAKAVENFKRGYNCAQSVTAAFADLYDIPQDLALRMSASFGGGIGRMRETCGAACGMFLLAGLETGSTTAGDRVGKGANYAVVQALAGEFRKRNGTLLCKELLGLVSKNNDAAKQAGGVSQNIAELVISSTPEERTENYYRKRPCTLMVEAAAQIFAEFLEKRELKCENDSNLV